MGEKSKINGNFTEVESMKINRDLYKLSDDELFDLNREIVALLKARHRLSNRNELSAFDLGDRVSFQGPERGTISGTIVRVNQKSLTIATEHGTWRIDPSFVVKEKGAKSSNGKVLKLHRSD